MSTGSPRPLRPLSGRFDQIPLESVLFGPEAVAKLAKECDRIGMRRILLVVSPTLAKTLDLGRAFDVYTQGRIVGIYDGSKPHVPHDVVLDAVAAARRADIDGIVSVGGGSPIDLAKAIALCLAQDVRSLEDLVSNRVRFEYPDKAHIPSIKDESVPHIAVSTTLSAAEFSGYIGITDTTRKVKENYYDSRLAPRIVVLDPTLAVHTPRSLWASTGLRAVDHAVEGLCSLDAQPISNVLYADALERLANYLPVSAHDASDLHAAGQCQLAAWESTFASTSVNLGLSHAIGHQLGARCGVPHGMTTCVVLPAVLEYNLEYTRDLQARIATIFGDALGQSVPEEFGASELIREFISSLGLPTRLSDVGVNRSDFAAIARDTMEDLTVATNPRPIASENEVIEVLEKAY